MDNDSTAIDADGTQTMLVLTILEKIREMRLKFSQVSLTVLQKILNYQDARVKLTSTQLNKLKSAAKNKRMNKNNFEGEQLPH